MPRPTKLTPAIIARARKLALKGASFTDIATETGVSRQTIQRALYRDPDYQREVESMRYEESMRAQATVKLA
jgi:hypothetical protein